MKVNNQELENGRGGWSACGPHTTMKTGAISAIRTANRAIAWARRPPEAIPAVVVLSGEGLGMEGEL